MNSNLKLFPSNEWINANQYVQSNLKFIRYGMISVFFILIIFPTYVLTRLYLDTEIDIAEKTIFSFTLICMLGAGVIFIHDHLHILNFIRNLNGDYLYCEWCRDDYPGDLINEISSILKKEKMSFNTIERNGFSDMTTLIPIIESEKIRIKKFFYWCPTPPRFSFLIEGKKMIISLIRENQFHGYWIYLQNLKSIEIQEKSDYRGNITSSIEIFRQDFKSLLREEIVKKFSCR